VIHAAQDLDLATAEFCHEQVSIGCGANQARQIEAARVDLDLESRGRLRPTVVRTKNAVGTIVDRWCGKWLGQIGGRDLAIGPRFLLRPVSEGRLAGDDLMGLRSEE